jgi:hypothetical protein
MSKTSPTQRTLKLCRDTGWTVQVVEKWNPFAKIRQDLFGFIDLVAMNGANIIGIQATSGANVSSRVDKIKENPKSAEWLRSGGRLIVHGWRKLKSSGRWECREIEITLEMLSA